MWIEVDFFLSQICYWVFFFRFYSIPVPAIPPDQPLHVEDFLLSPTSQSSEMTFDDGPGPSHLPEDQSKHLSLPGRSDKEIRSPKKVRTTFSWFQTSYNVASSLILWRYCLLTYNLWPMPSINVTCWISKNGVSGVIAYKRDQMMSKNEAKLFVQSNVLIF